jgi:two-component system, NtrC family, sensor kinase
MDLHILLVDDETDFRLTLAKRLKRRGLTPHQAADGEEGLALLDREPVDVVLLDMKMPGLDGVQVLDRIQQDHPGTKVIFLTGHANTADGVLGMKLGAFDYVAKPVDLNILIDKIQQADAASQAEAQARREAAHQQRIERQMIATDRLASLGTLATGVAHEINNPLSIIQQSAGLLADILQLPELGDIAYRERFEHALKQIDGAVDRVSQITLQLLGLVLGEEAPAHETRVQDLARRVCDLFESSANRRRVTLIVDAAPDLAPVPFEPGALRHIFVNLVSNGLYASPPGAVVHLRFQRQADCIRVDFVDEGAGIPAENMQYLFEPFWSTKDQGEGTGLGLYVTRRLLDTLGGSISVDSEVGRGTTVSIILPLGKPQRDPLG